MGTNPKIRERVEKLVEEAGAEALWLVKGVPDEVRQRVPKEHHDCWFALNTEKRLFGCGRTPEEAKTNLLAAQGKGQGSKH